MASLYVRELTRQWLSSLPTLRFYDTINRDIDVPDRIWVTTEFYASSKSGLMGCKGYMEDGVIDLMFMSKPGLGDQPLLTALEPAVAAFMTNKDPAGALTLRESEPIREVSSGDGDPLYRLGVGVPYAYSFDATL